jgi:hypothetical protein
MSELFVSSPKDLGPVILVEHELKGVPDRLASLASRGVGHLERVRERNGC